MDKKVRDGRRGPRSFDRDGAVETALADLDLPVMVLTGDLDAKYEAIGDEIGRAHV